jgi:glutaredoxin
MHVTLYSKPDCGLCEEVKADLLALQPQIAFGLHEVNIEQEPALFERFRYLIPVVDIEGGELLYPPHSIHQLYGALVAAQRPQL